MRYTLLILVCLCLAACDGQADPLSTPLSPTHTNLPPSPTFTLTPSLTLTPSPSPTLSLTPFLSLTPSRTVTPSSSWTPSPSQTRPPLPQITATLPPTATLTPSASPTRITNPDAIIGSLPAPLRIEPSMESDSLTELASNTALLIESRTADNAWLRVSLMSGMGNGWVAASEVIVFIDLNTIPLFEQPTNTTNITRSLGEPPLVTTLTAGAGVPFRPYDFAACGDTYWIGDSLGRSMEDLAYEGRYPRFATSPITVYVYGLATLPENELNEWELAISQTFAELSQAVRLERVYTTDLDFFQPFIPLETILADPRVDMVWHVVAADIYQIQAPCDDDLSCSQYGFDGAVKGGPLSFGGVVYIRQDVPDKRLGLLTAVLPALGLWVQSGNPADLMSPQSDAERMSPRDVNTLRCLYNAPPYGDGVLP